MPATVGLWAGRARVEISVGPLASLLVQPRPKTGLRGCSPCGLPTCPLIPSQPTTCGVSPNGTCWEQTTPENIKLRKCNARKAAFITVKTRGRAGAVQPYAMIGGATRAPPVSAGTR
ncbi:hypothetical protein V5799_027516 [Amblyomma americanum]|uniref:Uncharacterized protein n=1 Tax=Amblyomma americanum TaxID=6943 RepID=A0AAQ4DFH9_AMBAM